MKTIFSPCSAIAGATVIESNLGRMRHGTAAMLLLAGAFALALGARATPVTGVPVPGFEAYDATIPQLLDQGSLPGAAIAVAYRGHIVFARGYGYADRENGRPVQPDTRFRLASISKVFTAATVLKLVEDGKLSLDDRAFPLLGYPTPLYLGAARDPRLDQITVRQLLSHTAGWDSNTAHNPLVPGQIAFAAEQWQQDVARVMGTTAPASAETIVRFMVGQPLQFDSGTQWQYANIGFLTLGRIVEQKTGMTYEHAVQEFVANAYVSGLAISGSQRADVTSDEAVYYDYVNAPLQPLYLGAGNPLVAQPYVWSEPSFDATGGWCMSAIELLRFLIALDGRNGVPALLRPDSIASMRTAVPPSTRYGFGWFTANAANTDPPSSDSGHGGDSFGTMTWALRSADGDWLMVALVNGAINLGQIPDVIRVNNAASGILHTLPDFATLPPEHDFTWSTLGWEAWQRLHFPAAPSAALADPDGDGVPNLIEYAAGLDPTAAEAIPPASIGRDVDGTPIVTYRRLILEHPLSWTVEYTIDGAVWQRATTLPTIAINADGTLSCTVRTPDAIEARLRVHGVNTEATVSLPVPAPPDARLVNLSSRAHVGQGDDVLIAGFAIAGDQPRTVLIRGAGPALARFGVADTLPDPHITLYAGSRALATSDNWAENAVTIGGVAGNLGAFPFSATSRDSALLATLAPGSYSAVVSGAVASAGNGLVEIYEADRGASRLVNLSTRSHVGGSAGELIVGFVIGGDHPRRVLVRASGPSLGAFGLAQPLPDPALRLVRQSDGQVLARNIGWTHANGATEAEVRSAMEQVGAFGWRSGSADSAVLITLEPGVYSAVISSAGSAQGVALAEVYEIE